MNDTLVGSSHAADRFQSNRRRLLFGTTSIAVSALGFLPTPVDATEETTVEWLRQKNVADQTEYGRVGIVAGDPGGTYFSVANDLRIAIKNVVSKRSPQRIVPMVNEGSQETVTDLLYLKCTELGILQSDVMAEIRNLAEQEYPQAIIAKKWLRYVTKLYDEEVHLLSAGFESLDQLENATVNVGSKGSGTHYTAESILKAAGLDDLVHRTFYGKEKALTELKAGRIDAMFIVAGQPVREFTQLGIPRESEHFTLIPIDIDAGPQYTRTSLTKETYPFLQTGSVRTLSVASVMAAYDFPQGPRRRKLQRFCESFLEVQTELQENSLAKGLYHPKWQEFFKQKNLYASVAAWDRLEFMKKIS